MEYMDKEDFREYVNAYLEYVNGLVKSNNLSKEILFTPNEVLTALYYYNDFDEEEINTLINMVKVEEDEDLLDVLSDSLFSFKFKLKVLEEQQRIHSDLYYKCLVVKESVYGREGVDYKKLREDITKVNLIKKLGKDYEYYDETINDIVNRNGNVSCSYYSLLWDMGLDKVLSGTEYGEFFRYKSILNELYKEYYTPIADYKYNGEGLFTYDDSNRYLDPTTWRYIKNLDKIKDEKKLVKENK